MTTKARSGAGSKLKLGNGGSPESFTAVAELLTLKEGSTKIDLTDVTNLDSPSSNGLIYREKITGLADGGEIDFTYNYIPSSTSQNSLRSAIDGNPHNFRIVLPIDPATGVSFGYVSFAAYVILDDHDLPIDKQMVGTGKLSITGPKVFTVGAES